MPIRVTCTRGNDVTIRPFPSLVTSVIDPVSATAKLQPVMPISAVRKTLRNRRAGDCGQSGRIRSELFFPLL